MSEAPNAGLTTGEVARKLVHMSVGGIAFALAFLGPFWSAVCALAAISMNAFVLPRLGGRGLWRKEEAERGRSLGIVLYPTAVLVLILLFWRHLEVAAAVWGILAFGDGMASLVGMALGRRKLPWNPRKSWLGSLAYVVFGSAGATTLLLWTVRHTGGEMALGFALVAGFLAALFAAFLESLPQGLDDNLGVPLLTGAVLLGIVLSEGWTSRLDLGALAVQASVGGGVNLVLAAFAYRARSVDLSGAVAGWLVGTTIWGFLDWRGFLLLGAFFVLGTGATKLGYRRKAEMKLAQEKGGRRSARHAFANSGAAALLAVFAVTTGRLDVLLPAFAGAFATAAGDTMSSEIGQLLGRRTFLITTLRPVPRGTEGAVSVEGTVAGLVGSLAIALLGSAVGFYGPLGVALVTLAAFVGTTLESVVGATIEKAGLLDNEGVNFLNTLIGAVVAGVLAYAFL